MNTGNHKFKYSSALLVGLVLIGAQFARANETAFQNNLLKVDVNKTSIGDVKVTLYTSKPYKDAVVVNKKGANEYVILMPETSNSLTAKPSLKSASDVIQNVEIKTQQYAPGQGQKGYTKIVISSQTPIEINAQTQSLNTQEAPISEKEYKELMAHTAKKPVAQVVIPSKKTPPARPTLTKERTVKMAAKTKPATTKPKTFSKPVTAKKQQVKIAQAPIEQKIAEQTQQIKKEAEKVSQETLTPQTQTQEQQTQPTVPEIQEQTAPQSIEPQATLPAAQPKAPQNGLSKYKHLIKTHLNEIMIGLAGVIILLLLLIKRASRTANKTKEEFVPQMEETPAPINDYSDKISEDMTWKEKYQTFVEASSQPATNPTQQPTSQPEEDIATNKELEALFSDDAFTSDQEGFYTDIESQPFMEEQEKKFIQKPAEQIQETIKASIEPEEEPEEEPVSVPQTETSQNVLEELDGLKELEDFIFNEAFESKMTEETEEVSIEDLFKEELEPEPKQQRLEQKTGEIEPLPEQQKGVSQTQTQSQSQPLIPPLEAQTPHIPQAPKVEEQSKQSYESTFMSNPLQEEPQKEKEDDNMILSKFEIDTKRGFCLVEFEEATSLVGYIGEEIFVIKQFNETIKGKLQARLSEVKGTTEDYIVKIGNFKAMVEVGSKNMNCLIEL